MKDIESFIFDENYFKNKYVSHCVLFNKEENVKLKFIKPKFNTSEIY